MIRRFVMRIVDFGGAHPLIVIFIALAALFGSYEYTQSLQLRSDLLELLPRESPGFKAFEHQLGRVGGGASLLVIAESPSRKANEKLIDKLADKLEARIAERKKCIEDGHFEPFDPRGVEACGPELISYIERGTKDVRQFFRDKKWLYASIEDLRDADATLDQQIAIKSGLVSDLESDDDDLDDEDDDLEDAPKAPAPKPAGQPPTASTDAPPPAGKATVEKKPALGMDSYRDRWQQKADEHDDFPTGYFCTQDGRMHGLRIISTTAGMGDANGDRLMDDVRKMVEEIEPKSLHAEMDVGFAGDIANVIEEKESLVSEAAWATGIAFILILGGVVVFFRSPWSLVVIALPAAMGVACAYSFATWKFGYVNTAGLFLGAIIVGNGINYPIVLLARYREFRARGQGPAEARRDAVWNAFRAELVGAGVAGIAYGSLSITSFRGFSQFGIIGFVGMLLVWLTMIPLVPALLVAIEAVQARLPVWLRDPPAPIAADGSRPLMRFFARVTERFPYVFVTAAAVLTLVAVWKLPRYLADPWEYNFDKLGSRGSKVTGAGIWSNKAEQVFGGKMNIAGAQMLADTPEQVPLIKEKILQNDAADPEGQLIAEVATVADLLPGAAPDQQAKLDVLDQIRSRLTPAVMHGLDPEERKRVEEIRPPDEIEVVKAEDLPPLLRRRFSENNGTVGTLFYVKYRNDVSLSDGRNLLRIADKTDNVKLDDGTIVQTASRATIFAEMIRSMERDGPLASFASFGAVMLVVILATFNFRGSILVLASLVMGVAWTVGGAAIFDTKLNYLNFIALPITFGIGCEYPFNVYDRARLLGGDVSAALGRTGGAVALCSYTTIIGYGSLLFADFQALQSFGLLAMSGELATFLAALLVLPALLHLWRDRRAKRDATEARADGDASSDEGSTAESDAPDSGAGDARAETADPAGSRASDSPPAPADSSLSGDESPVRAD